MRLAKPLVGPALCALAASGPGCSAAPGRFSTSSWEAPDADTGGSGDTGDTGVIAGSDASVAAPVEWAPTEAVSYAATDEAFMNPERGFHLQLDLTTNRNPKRFFGEGVTLVYAPVLLDAFRDGPISDTFLDQLETGLDILPTGGIKVFLRFMYNSGYDDDASLERIREHLVQLGPILRDHEDVIAWMEAGFIGAWGEWHDSTQGLDTTENRLAVAEAILDELPASRMILLRTPVYKEEMYGAALTAEEAWTGTDKARIGHHDDCFLATETDAGTYPRDEIDHYKEYVAQDTLYTPRGGETCSYNAEAQRADCATALHEMEWMHWTYFAYNDDLPHLDEWRADGCYEEIERRLGYRLRLVDADVPTAVRPGGRFHLRVALHNDGFAAVVNPRPVLVVLTDGTTRLEAELPHDPRAWAAGADVVVRADLELPAGMAEGDWKLALWLPDAAATLREDPRYALRFANEATWDGATGQNVLGTVTIDDDAAGKADPAAGALRVLD